MDPIIGTYKSFKKMTDQEIKSFEKDAFDRRKSLGLADAESNRGLKNNFSTSGEADGK